MGEFELIRRYFRPTHYQDFPEVALGIGDDCAILTLQPGEQLCTSIDTLVESVHFPVSANPLELGWRCLSVAISDLAACGARPVGFCLALCLPVADEQWLETFAQGLAEASAFFRIPLVGGDTTRGPLTLSLQVFGAVKHDTGLLRSAGRQKDDVWVTGTLGNARAALDFLESDAQATPAVNALLSSYYRPGPPVSFAHALTGLAHAAIDISDGLLADLGHILEASSVGAELQLEAIPLSAALCELAEHETALGYALTGGDDYQLCFTADPKQREALQALARLHELRLTLIGTLTDDKALRCLDGQGKHRAFEQTGYQHF